MSWLRRHALLIGALFLAAGWFASFTWSEWHYFLDQAASHHEPLPAFWDAEHLHDWLYNLSANVVSEVAFGIVFVMLALKFEGRRGADRGDT